MQRTTAAIRISNCLAIAAAVFMLSGCAERNYQSLEGAPDGVAEVLVQNNEKTPELEHEEGPFLEAASRADRVVLVEFWGPYCGPCRHLAPVLEKIATTYPDQVSVVKVNVQSAANAELANFFGIHAIPEMRIFVDGQSSGAIHGYVDAGRISDTLEPLLSRIGDSKG